MAKHTITIADIDININTTESPEMVDKLVTVVDQRIREIISFSPRLSKSEAAILCAVDGTCGTSIIGSIREITGIFVNIPIASSYDLSQFQNLAAFIKQVTCPWLYIDDIIGMFLITLAGAIFFETGKTAKTILFYIAISFVLGITVTPFANAFFKEFAVLNFTAKTPEAMNQLFSMSIFKHIALFDTINDTLVNLALIVSIYFRVKTLKH